MPTRQIKCLKKRIANKVTKIVYVQCVKVLFYIRRWIKSCQLKDVCYAICCLLPFIAELPARGKPHS